MLKKVKHFLEVEKNSEVSFHEFYVNYMMKVQDSDIDLEVKNLLNFNLLQVSQYDNLIDLDYRRLVNEENVRFKQA